MQSASRIELKNIVKKFGDRYALNDFSVSFTRGKIHALVGENGAGKSSAMKVLYGQYRPDSGQLLADGKEVVFRTPVDALRLGIGMVHQHFLLADTHTVLENILLGQSYSPLAKPQEAKARRLLEQLMQQYGLAVDLDAKVSSLPVGLQQRSEILKVLYRNPDWLILDEPTAVLAPSEIEGLFQIVRSLASSGKSVLIITHKLKEVMALADEVTVLREGRNVFSSSVSGTTPEQLADKMVGYQLQSENYSKSSVRGSDVKVLEVLKATDRQKNSKFKIASFSVCEGEVVGIAGVEGNGQSELLSVLLNPAERLEQGDIFFNGQKINHLEASDVRGLGVAHFPEDRLRDALLLDQDLLTNFLLGKQRSKDYNAPYGLRFDRITKDAVKQFTELDVRPLQLHAIAGDLSGGNQQKLVVARELHSTPKLLIAAQPTRGVDIGAIQLIHSRILNLKDSGAGVLLLSSELDELIKLSDRMLVFFQGEIIGQYSRGDFDESLLGQNMAGIRGGNV